MTKHPNSFKLNGDLVEKNAAVTSERTVLYDGESINDLKICVCYNDSFSCLFYSALDYRI